jgi:hypothetical protein
MLRVTGLKKKFETDRAHPSLRSTTSPSRLKPASSLLARPQRLRQDHYSTVHRRSRRAR